LALCLLSPFVGEILSSNVLPSLFVRQPVMIVFAALTYSLPVLLIRELVVARTLSLWGVLLCGLAYGLFNEGLLARTILMTEGLPIPVFDGFLSIGGLSVGWGATMLAWHAIFSVATPILLVHGVWPEHASREWLPRGAQFAAVVVCLASTLLFFRTDQGPAPSAALYALFAGLIAALLALAQLTRGAIAAQFKWLAFFAGLASFAFFGGLFLLAGARLPEIVFVTWAVLAGAASVFVLRRLDSPLPFCLGACTAYALFVFIAKQHASLEGSLVTALITAGLFLAVRRLRA
jgi:hypothetical protein